MSGVDHRQRINRKQSLNLRNYKSDSSNVRLVSHEVYRFLSDSPPMYYLDSL